MKKPLAHHVLNGVATLVVIAGAFIKVMHVGGPSLGTLLIFGGFKVGIIASGMESHGYKKKIVALEKRIKELEATNSSTQEK